MRNLSQNICSRHVNLHLSQDMYGLFHSGDCYIILATTANAVRALEWNIHFWIGKEAEHGIGIDKTVVITYSFFSTLSIFLTFQ